MRFTIYFHSMDSLPLFRCNEQKVKQLLKAKHMFVATIKGAATQIHIFINKIILNTQEIKI